MRTTSTTIAAMIANRISAGLAIACRATAVSSPVHSRLGDGDEKKKHDEPAEEDGHDPCPFPLALADDLVLDLHHGRNRSATSTANKAKR